MTKNFLLVVGALSVIVAACGVTTTSDVNATLAAVPTEYAGRSNPFGADAANSGADIFKTNCSPCHGSQGRGDGPAGAALNPPPKNLVELQTKASDDYLFWRINTGKDGTSMVAWKGVLTDEQIWQVIAFLHTLK